MKNFKNLLIVLLLICVVACTVSSVSATTKVVEKNSDISFEILDEDTPLSVPTDLIEGKLEKYSGKDGNTVSALHKGFYIAQVNGKAYKVVLNSDNEEDAYTDIDDEWIFDEAIPL